MSISTVDGVFYLVLSRKRNHNWKLAARLTANKPVLSAGEVAVLLTVELPTTLFQRPQLEAKVVVPATGVPKEIISADVMDNVAALLSDQLGMVVRVTAEDQA